MRWGGVWREEERDRSQHAPVVCLVSGRLQGEGEHLLFIPPGPELRDSPLCLDLQTGEGSFPGADRTAGAGPQVQGPALFLLPHLALPEDHETQAAGPGVTP